MLNDKEIENVWDGMLDAETYALYFAELANRYSKVKTTITFATLFLASTAAATLIAKAPTWVAIVLSLVTAFATAYSVATSLDGKIQTLVKLHAGWSTVADDYEQLWLRSSEASPASLYDLRKREKDLSEMAVTNASNDKAALMSCQRQVWALHGVAQ